jgi:peptidoglycan hydrolase-like protein with peptidoglycan-binding domain
MSVVKAVPVRLFIRIAGVLAMAVAALVPAVASASSSSSSLGSRTLRQGMSGADVSTLQQQLGAAGFSTPVTGTYSAATAKTVESFEKRYQLSVNGVADSNLVQELQKIVRLDKAGSDAGVSGGAGISVKTAPASKKATTAADPTSALNTDPVLAPVARNGASAHLGNRTLRPGMSGHDVRVLQDYLTIDGYPTSVDGNYGPSTKTSVVAFESANDLSENGILTYGQSRVLRKDVAKAMGTTGTTGTGTTGTTGTGTGTTGTTGTGGTGGGGTTGTTATATATLNSDGTVTAPAGAPAVVQQVIAAANQIINTPYIYGGGHASFTDSGYDCSGAVSYALHGGGLLSTPEDSTQLESYGDSGPGQYITVYADSAHAFVVVDGLAFDTAHYGTTIPSGSGPRWLPAADATANLSDGGNYIVRHPTGL